MPNIAVVRGAASVGSVERLKLGARLPELGDSIGGKYSIVRQIGEGGMAVVYEALHVQLGQRLAIKVLRPEVGDLDVVLARFAREARATASLRSIHTARVIDVDSLDNGLPFMVLEYLEGRDLDAELQAVGPFPIAEAVDVVIQVADAMAEAHEQGLVHRDLKPANLFVCHAGERRVIKILDFGISRNENDSSRITAVDSYFGTPAYAAPEQLRDASQADARSDIWSLGIILFELLTGRTPFEGTAVQVIAKVVADPVPWPLDLRPDIPRELARSIMRALQRDPAQRFKTMRELSAALAHFGPEQTLASALEPAMRGRRRLGEILVTDGLLSQGGLDLALADQQRTGKLLGQVLLDLKLVGGADLLAAVAKQQGLHVEPSPAPHPDEPLRKAATAPALVNARTARLRQAFWPLLALALGLGLLVQILHALGR